MNNTNNINNYNNNPFLYPLLFPFICSKCKEIIYDTLYFCEDCKILYCPICEREEGPKHNYPFCKAGNEDQFDYLINFNKSTFDKFKEQQSKDNNLNILLLLIGDNNYQNNIQCNNNKVERVSLVQFIKKKYDLGGFSDKEIEEALIKTKGNLAEAITILYE